MDGAIETNHSIFFNCINIIFKSFIWRKIHRRKATKLSFNLRAKRFGDDGVESKISAISYVCSIMELLLIKFAEHKRFSIEGGESAIIVIEKIIALINSFKSKLATPSIASLKFQFPIPENASHRQYPSLSMHPFLRLLYISQSIPHQSPIITQQNRLN
ncbi:hypothetical protein X798_06371 [Onchocerca flexuosa]|uniref:Uncharacterized protein n=1 Tax=Onchocerca flexuosa TaxID=387005 RepID=A0A238BNP3_9BILA|nr:hypothetical protein X798_06371 [Onchocerca flexuosa]